MSRPGNRILYHHTGAAAGTDTLRYTVRDSSDSLAPATVTVIVSGAMRLANTAATLPPGPPPSVFGVVNAFPNIGFWHPTTMESPARRPEAAIRRRAGRENLSHPGHQRAHRDQEGNEAQRRHEIQLPVMVHAAHSGDKHGFLDPRHGRPSLAPHRAQKLPSFASPTNAGPGATGHSVCKMDFSLSKF
ncbi:MAG: hypothetical protein VCA38_15915 [Roseibacillus sp.]